MTTEKQIIAISELDGWFDLKVSEDKVYGHKLNARGDMTCNVIRVPSYLTSRDAIVPVIEKVMNSGLISITGIEILIQFNFLTTASQLSEALLRATGKWVEE